MMPVVTQTTAALGLRPVAKALGTSLWAMPTLGLGMSASAQRRSTIACSSGASCSETTRACIENSAILSEKKYWANSRPPAMMMTSPYETPTASSAPMNAT